MTPNPRGFPTDSPTARACDHYQSRAPHRAPADAPRDAAPLVNRRYLAALAADRAKLTRAPADSATPCTVKLWHEEKRIRFDIVENGESRTIRKLAQFAFARVRYGTARRAWFILRASSLGATIHDSRLERAAMLRAPVPTKRDAVARAHRARLQAESKRTLDSLRDDLPRLGLNAEEICSHLASVIETRAPRAPRVVPEVPQSQIGTFTRAPITRAPRLKVTRERIAPRDFRAMNGGALASHNRGESRKASEAFNAARIAPLLPARIGKGKPLTRAEFEARRISHGSPRVNREHYA